MTNREHIKNEVMMLITRGVVNGSTFGVMAEEIMQVVEKYGDEMLKYAIARYIEAQIPKDPKAN